MSKKREVEFDDVDSEMVNPLRSSSGPSPTGGAVDAVAAAAQTTPDMMDGEDGEELDRGILHAFASNFMGAAPGWYKGTVVGFLLLNIPLQLVAGKKAAAWAVLLEFIFTLAMTTHCYPLHSGGLVVVEGLLMGLAPPSRLEHEVAKNIDILLLVTFMVACVHFLKNLLLWVFTNILLKLKSKVALSLAILFVSAVMSAFLDALSVSAVLISVCHGVLGIYYHAVENDKLELSLSGGGQHDTMAFELVPHHHHHHQDGAGAEQQQRGKPAEGAQASGSGEAPLSPTTPKPAYPGAPLASGPQVLEPAEPKKELHEDDIAQFQAFLRSLLVHGAIGTAIGGCTTIVGEPQNLVIAKRLEWDFVDFLVTMAPVSAIVWPVGMVTCVALETIQRWNYGGQMPAHVRQVLVEFVEEEYGRLHSREKAELLVQAGASLLLIVALVFHLTEVGFVGLAIVILVTTLNGETVEHDTAHAFLEAMPFVSLLVVFFGVVAILEEQHVFTPVIDLVLELPTSAQPSALYLVNGFLSMVSDNVFVATIFIESVAAAREGDNAVNMTRTQFENLAVAINMGTNLPSCATPNGQAAFLFILTSAVSPLVHLSYTRMVQMTLPYTIMLTISGLIGILTLDSGD